MIQSKGADLDRVKVMQKQNLLQILQWQACSQSGRRAYAFLDQKGDIRESVTWSELDTRVRKVAGLLQERGCEGDRVVLFYSTGVSFIAAFLGCLAAGMPAVPLYPPRSRRRRNTVEGILEKSGASMILCDDDQVPRIQRYFDRSRVFAKILLLGTDHLSSSYIASWRLPRIESDTLAFLQFTSGSTGSPKGVMVSHGNLMANENAIQVAFQTSGEDICVGWLPLYHDMGLIGNVLQALFTGFSSLLMDPTCFVQDPMLWLECVSRYRASLSGGPNFAFDLCRTRATRERMEGLDLSCWRVAFNGAEPVRAATLEAFAETFKPTGFRYKAFFPCYGMAEATLFIAGKNPASAPNVIHIDKSRLENRQVIEVEPDHSRQLAQVHCGRSDKHHRQLVVDPNTLLPRPENQVGEIWFSGPSVAGGYWGLPEKTVEAFGARLMGSGEGPFLRTGDLGFLRDGEIYITGRLKDLIIIRGRNYYPQDIEECVFGCHPALLPGFGAAFSIEVEAEEKLVVIQEVDRRFMRKVNKEELIAAIRTALADEFALDAHAVVLLRPASVLKTASGKIRRSACREAWLKGLLSPLETHIRQEHVTVRDEIKLDREILAGTASVDRPALIKSWLHQQAARLMKLDECRIERHTPLSGYGLDSMAAINLQHLLETQLGLALRLGHILGDTSIDDLASEILRQPLDTPRYESTSPAGSGRGPLSFNQQTLWFLYRLAPESSAYNVSFALKLHPPLDVDALRRAFLLLADRHACLRTTFADGEDGPVRVILDDAQDFFSEVALPQEAVADFCAERVDRPFCLERGVPIRVNLITDARGPAVLLMTAHHILIDFWSMVVLMNELRMLYSPNSQAPALPRPGRDYGDFVVEQRTKIEGKQGRQLRAFWENQLSGDLDPLDLPFDRPRPVLQSFRGAEVDFSVGSALSARLDHLAAEARTTRFSLLLSVFQVLLHRYTGRQDITTGIPSAGRGAAYRDVVGYFVNPIVVRGRPRGDRPFRTFLAETDGTFRQALDHGDYPFQLLVEHIQSSRDPARSPLFQVMFSLQKAQRLGEVADLITATAEGKRRLGELTLEAVSLPKRSAQFDLSLFLIASVDEGTGLKGRIEYNSDLFDQTTIERLADHYHRLLEAVVANPDACLCSLKILSEQEREQVLERWNDTRVNHSNDLFIHHLFEQQARRTPEAVAVTVARSENPIEPVTLSYRELDAYADALACRLQRSGAGPESLLAVSAESSPATVAAILAILKVGAGYVPLDRELPEERIHGIVEDAGIELIVGTNSPKWPQSLRVIDTDSLFRFEPEGAPTLCELLPENVCYVLFTSGSTGKPKGVMIPHGAIANHMRWMQRVYPLSVEDKVLQKTPAGFDASVWEFYAPLLIGAVLVLAERGAHRDSRRLTRIVREEDITILQVVPTLLGALLEEPDFRKTALRRVFCGGEALRVSLRDRFQAKMEAELVNLYGPTETCIHAATDVCEHGRAIVPIGRPIDNGRLYILDAKLQPVPIGVPGELYVAGEGLGRGYLNRLGLTASKFIPDPFADRPGRRLYRSGDRVRYRPDGAVAFLERMDNQVKLRGYRIELGEIESVLCSHSDVKGAAVLLREDMPGGPGLAAYLSGFPRKGDPETLREYCHTQLPDYMVPVAFVVLDALPMTANGKLDRKALPVPVPSRGSRERALPQTPTQSLLVDLWREVLDLEMVGIDDNFFDLGGHSLLGTRLMSRLPAVFSHDLPLRVLFEAPTVRSLAGRIDQTMQDDGRNPMPPLVAAIRSGHLPLSFAQQRLWFLNQLEGQNPTYNLPGIMRLIGGLDFSALEQSFRGLIERHETLRTHFVQVNGEAVQVIEQAPCFQPVFCDLSGLAEKDREKEARRLVLAQAAISFDLGHFPLMRVHLVRLNRCEHFLAVTLHHIVSDGWSTGVLLNDFSTLYRAALEHVPDPLQQLPIQYADFTLWQRGGAFGQALASQEAYWLEELKNVPVLSTFPTDRPRPARQTYRGACHTFDLEARGIGEVSRQNRCTPFMTLFSAFAVLLYRYSGHRELVIGTPIANRNRREIEPLIGFFANTLAVRFEFREEMTVEDLLQQVRARILEAHAHQDVPFEALVERLQPERHLSHSVLFQTMFTLEETPLKSLELAGLKLTPQPTESHFAKFDISLNLEKDEGGCRGALEYNTDLYDPETIKRIGDHFKNVLIAMVEDPAQPVDQMALMGRFERERLLLDWNRTDRDFGPFVPLHRLFEANVAKGPESIAVQFAAEDEQTWSYAELDQRADRLSQALRARGVGPETLVGVFHHRSFEMVVSLLGILKTGAAYVPMDPDQPKERIAAIVADAGLEFVVTLRQQREQLPECIQAVYMDAPLLPLDHALPDNEARPDHACYVLYTSGSTGKPKGVVISLGAIVNHMRWMQRVYPLTREDRVIQKTPVGFDASVWEFYAPLLVGGGLVVAEPGAHRDPRRLAEMIERHRVTILQVVPSLLQGLLEEPLFAAGSSLRRLFCGGEALPAQLRDRCHELMKVELVNLYGPTETCIHAATDVCEPGRPVVPIGRPIDNGRLYILDGLLAAVPVAVLGELHVGGIGLGRGFLNRTGLTAEKFIPDPFSREPGQRLYKTGDRTRFLADGAVEFRGRVDFQIKLRGFRIEPGEIESALREHPEVREALVVILPEKQQLVAYITGTGDPTADQLRRMLKHKLPAYMVPSAFVVLDSFPLASNGKVNRTALPLPEIETGTPGAAAPRTPTQEILCRVWEELLEVESLSIDDNFFNLGGHSLQGTRLMSRLPNVFGVSLPLAVLFAAPTIRELGERIDKTLQNGAGNDLPRPTPRPRSGNLPLSFAQQRLWFLDQLDETGAAYNLPGTVGLSGPFDISAFERAFQELTARHETLRTRFIKTERDPIQVIEEELLIEPIFLDLGGLPVERARREAMRIADDLAAAPFDLAVAPLFRVYLMRTDHNEHLLSLSMHHIISDGWSTEILLRDFAAIYRTAPLQPLPIQYSDFTLWQRDWLDGGLLEKQETYWTAHLENAPVQSTFPEDGPRPAVQTYRGAFHLFDLDAGLTSRIDELARQSQCTPFMTLFSAFALLLQRYSGSSDLVIGTPIANRNRAEIEDLIGFFANTLAVRLQFNPELEVRDLLDEVRARILEAHAHQDIPFEHLVERLQPERHLSHAVLFQTMFTLAEAPLKSLELPGLEVTPRQTKSRFAKFDISLGLERDEDSCRATLEYNTDLYGPETIKRIAEHFQNVLFAMTEDPAGRVAEVALLGRSERDRLLLDWNRTEQDYGLFTPIHELFEAVVDREPASIAVQYSGDEQTWSYAELNQRAERLSRLLRFRGVGPEKLVGVLHARSLELVVCLLGILKTGAAYLPMDPDQPKERIAAIVADAGLDLVVTQPEQRQQLPEMARAVYLDDPLPAISCGRHEARPDHACYVLYTSGSIGKPKGVVISHGAISNHMHWMQRVYPLTREDRVIQKTPVGFDASVWEFYAPLLVGGRLIVAEPGAHRDPRRLAEVIESHGVTILQVVPGLLQGLLEEPLFIAGYSLRRLFCGGEALPAQVRDRCHELMNVELVNLYGPTETCIHAATEVCRPGQPVVPIGRPIDNGRLYILDGFLAPVPVGAPGELHVGGEGLGRCFLNRAKLTAEKFIPDPFGPPGQRLYKTGDLTCFLADGRVEFKSRVDFQIKLRGFRIEPGEIESVLREHPEVREAVVLLREDNPGNPRLVAYVTGSSDRDQQTGSEQVSEALQWFLRDRIPEYMIPVAFEVLENMPLTNAGKLDRKALPCPSMVEQCRRFTPPRTSTEKLLSEIWAELLGRKDFSIYDDFFLLGGHSLSATRVVSRLRETHELELSVIDFFKLRTIAGLAEHIEKHQRVAAWAVAPESAAKASEVEVEL